MGLHTRRRSLPLSKSLLLWTLSLPSIQAQTQKIGCPTLNYCNGHGTCDTTNTMCSCNTGWGSSSETFAIGIAKDCSERTCPTGKSFGDIPTAITVGHAVAECSNAGTCNRAEGTCTCRDGYSGKACQILGCPNDCSGHGKCFRMSQLAKTLNAIPVSDATYYGTVSTYTTTTWDSNQLAACVCESSWSVGLTSGALQTPEWFGPDCSLRHCPSGNDPMTTLTDETSGATINCGAATGFIGATGNLCLAECSNRGKCDHVLGECTCFKGYTGVACETASALVV